jgi:hypothetical protein
MRTSQKLGFLAVVLLVPCLAASAKHGDVKNTSRPISGVTSNFQLLNAVIRSGEPIRIRVTLHNESASPVEFRYVTGSFIEHIRIYDARHRQVLPRLNAPFLESGAEKINLQPGEQLTNVVAADLWQMYDLEPGTYELRFYYDLRLIADEALAAKSMKRYHSKDWILWNMKTYPLTVIDAEVSDATRNSLEHAAEASRMSTTVASTTSERPEVSKNVTHQSPTVVAMMGLANAGSKQQPIQFLLSVSQEKPNSGVRALQLILVNTSRVLQDLSKTGKISVTCKIGAPTLYVPGQYIGITRSLEPEIAALKLKPGKWVAQEIGLQPELSAQEIAEVSASCEIGGVAYKSNTIYLSER